MLIPQIEQYVRIATHWWVVMLAGIALFFVGLLIFGYPGTSYLGMSVAFSLLMLLTGISQISIAITERNLGGRGWIATGGAIETIIGFLLLLNPAISAFSLPFLLGFWLLFRSIGLIGIASEMSANKVPGMGWTIMTAILLLICAFIILLHPLTFGVDAVVIWVGISLLLAGISSFVFAIRLRNIRKALNK